MATGNSVPGSMTGTSNTSTDTVSPTGRGEPNGYASLDATAQVPVSQLGHASGGGGGISPPAGDLGGTAGTPTVTGTHLASPLPVTQGGTASSTAAGALTALGAASVTALTTETSRATGAEVLKAPLASPALTGTPTAPTQTAGDSSTRVATDAFVATAVAAETARAGTAEASLAPLTSAALTGTPTAPTATALTSSTQIATTAYADASAAAAGGGGSSSTSSVYAQRIFAV